MHSVSNTIPFAHMIKSATETLFVRHVNRFFYSSFSYALINSVVFLVIGSSGMYTSCHSGNLADGTSVDRSIEKIFRTIDIVIIYILSLVAVQGRCTFP